MRLAFQHWPAHNLTKNVDSPLPATPAPRIGLLHGMGGTGALWRPIGASLENHFHLMSFDQRGHGRSRPDSQQGGYTPLDYGRDVIETLEAENFHPTWLIGHSMGVRTACAAAHLKPEWIRGLILVDLGFSGAPGGGLGEGLATFVRGLPEQFATREEARAFMTEHCPDPSIGQYLMAVSVRAASGAVSFPFDHRALIETIQAASQVSVRDWVDELVRAGMPILVLRGANSLVWSRADYQKEQEHFAEFPSIRFMEFEGAGHGLPFEQRPRFVAEIESFIGAHS
jgi:esterase